MWKENGNNGIGSVGDIANLKMPSKNALQTSTWDVWNTLGWGGVRDDLPYSTKLFWVNSEGKVLALSTPPEPHHRRTGQSFFLFYFVLHHRSKHWQTLRDSPLWRAERELTCCRRSAGAQTARQQSTADSTPERTRHPKKNISLAERRARGHL